MAVRAQYGRWMWVLCWVALIGCSGVKQPPQQISYYVLEYPPPATAGGPALPFSLRIDTFATAAVYDSTRMLFKEKPFVRNEYVYHHWRTAPGQMASALLRRDFRHAADLEAVIDFDTLSVSKSAWILKGMVEEFYQHADTQQWSAVISLSITLIRRDAGLLAETLISQKSYHVAQALDERSPAGFAAAMSSAMQRTSQAIIHDVIAVMRRHR